MTNSMYLSCKWGTHIKSMNDKAVGLSILIIFVVNEQGDSTKGEALNNTFGSLQGVTGFTNIPKQTDSGMIDSLFSSVYL